MTLCWCGSLTLKFGIKQVVEGQIATLNNYNEADIYSISRSSEVK